MDTAKHRTQISLDDWQYRYFTVTRCGQFFSGASTWLPAAILRWLQEQPDVATGLGLLERLALTAIRSGCRTPADIFTTVAAHDTPPQYWGDITLWAKINGLATREPPLVTITGPTPLLPQWDCQGKLGAFRIHPTKAIEGSY
jgi:hypothetical protein